MEPSSRNRRTLQACTIWFISYNFILLYFHLFIYFTGADLATHTSSSCCSSFDDFSKLQLEWEPCIYTASFANVISARKMSVSEWTLIGHLETYAEIYNSKLSLCHYGCEFEHAHSLKLWSAGKPITVTVDMCFLRWNDWHDGWRFNQAADRDSSRVV